MNEDLKISVRVGEVLAGKYRVDRVLGAGGMGVVVGAMHLQLDQTVALKFLRSDALMTPEIVSRFEREARAAVRLKSEHSARIIDVGRLESGSPYIVMEYLEGRDLAQLIDQRGALPVAVACDYVIQACDAIAEAHSLGIVHRDLKPGNLFLAKTSHAQEVVKVLDFGISKSQGASGEPSMTRTQAIMGSPGYMSPEQMRSTKGVDGRSDIWSLGIILYELVAGRAPFRADTFSALCVKIAVDPHPALPALPSTLPAGFEAVINRALEKNPALRHQSAAELAHALAPYAGAQAREQARRLMAATPNALPSAACHVALSATANTLDAAAAQARSGPRGRAPRARKLIAAGIGVAVAVAIGGLLGARSGNQRDVRGAREPVTERRAGPSVGDAAVVQQSLPGQHSQPAAPSAGSGLPAGPPQSLEAEPSPVFDAGARTVVQVAPSAVDGGTPLPAVTSAVRDGGTAVEGITASTPDAGPPVRASPVGPIKKAKPPAPYNPYESPD